MNADSVKARLKNLAINEGGTFQDKLVTYALERSVYRLSVSEYADRFTLKGGIFLYVTSLGLAGSRYKDFYDIYILANKFDLDGIELQEAVRETFSNRETSIDDIAAFDEEFTADSVRQNRWKAFVKKKKAMEQVSFEDAIALVKRVLSPIANAVKNHAKFDKSWSCAELQWK